MSKGTTTDCDEEPDRVLSREHDACTDIAGARASAAVAIGGPGALD